MFTSFDLKKGGGGGHLNNFVYLQMNNILNEVK